MKITTKLYMAMEADKETDSLLQEFCKVHGIDCDTDHNKLPGGFEFHTTIMHSENEIPFDTDLYGVYPLVPKMEVQPLGYDIFGPEKNCLVLKLKPNKRIIHFRNKAEAMGLKSSYPTFEPHMTLSYNHAGKDISTLKLPPFRIYVNTFKVAAVT